MGGCQRVRARDKFVLLVYGFLVQRRQQQQKKKSTSYPKGTAKGKKGRKMKRALVKRALSVVWGPMSAAALSTYQATPSSSSSNRLVSPPTCQWYFIYFFFHFLQVRRLLPRHTTVNQAPDTSQHKLSASASKALLSLIICRKKIAFWTVVLAKICVSSSAYAFQHLV